MATKKKSRSVKKRAEFKLESPKVEIKEVKPNQKFSIGDNGFLKMVAIVFGVILILMALAYISKWTSKKQVKQLKIVEKTDKGLPQGWMKVEGSSDQVKYEKKTSSTIKPTVVLIQSQSNITSAVEYSDKLIAGARSAIPSLVIEENTTGKEGSYFTRTISGYYYNGNDQIGITQKLLINGNRIKTLTASYDPQDTKITSEITKLFDYLVTTL